jgi:hypothetical protein
MVELRVAVWAPEARHAITKDRASMAASLTVRGLVRDALTDIGVSSGVACLTRAHDLMAQAPIEADGTFELSTSPLDAGSYDLTLLAGGLEAWRRPIEVGDFPTVETVGTVELRATEYPPGVYGQFWDAPADRPITAGQVRLEQDGNVVARDSAAADGTFAIEMSCTTPLPAGDYELVLESAGYAPARVPLRLGELPLAHQLGRVELSSAEPGQANAGD